MRHLKESIKLFRYRTGKLLLFELLAHFAGIAVLFPLFYFAVNLSIRMAGISYLSRDNIGTYLKHPSTYLMLLLYLLLVAAFMIFHVTAVISYSHAAKTEKKTGVFRMIRAGISGLVRSLRPKNLLLLPLVYFFVPISLSALIGANILNLHLPAYVSDLLRFKGHLKLIYTSVFVLLNLFFLRNMSLFHVFSLEKKPFPEAFRESRRKQKKKRMFAWNVFWMFIIFGGTLLLQFLIEAMMRRIFMVRGMIDLFRILYQSLTMALFVLFWLFALPVVLCGITVSCEGFSSEEEESPEEEEESRKAVKKERLFIVLILLVSLILNTGFYFLRKVHVFSLNAEYLNTVTITAHRGDSKRCPENTLAAFSSAIESGADVIEMDVRQTKDGVVVISHDENIRRVSGVNKKVGRMTYAELQEASAGKNFGNGYESEPFPTLEEAVRLIGDDARLNIELKPATTDTDLVEQVVRIVEEYDLIDKCVVTSQNYNAIRQVKKLNDSIRTVYVMSVALGDFYELKYADAFSIKYTYINSRVVKLAHKHGKEVYAWTVDSRAGLKKMMMLHVDSIITNKPYEMRQMMLDIYYGNTLYESIMDLFK